MRNMTKKEEAECTAYLNACCDELNALNQRVDRLRETTKEKTAFDARYDARMQAFREATGHLEGHDPVFLEALIRVVKAFVAGEQLT